MSTPDSSGSNAVVAAPSSAARRESAPRQKRWAPRSRSGCFTCRTCRVRCDEAKPVCGRCVRLGKHCSGYGVVMPVRTTATSTTSSSQVGSDGTRALSRQKQPLCVEAEPPDWDHMQAIQFFVLHLHPQRSAHLPQPPAPRFDTWSHVPAFFICSMISQQIQWASASRGSVLRPGEDPAFAGTWVKYFHYYRELLGVTNRCIQGSDPHGGKYRALFCIFALFGIDVQFDEFLWQAHLNAGLAYAEKMGGLEALLTFPARFSAHVLKNLKHVLLASIMCNTTSPASKQIRGAHTYTDAELATIIESVEILEPPLAADIFIAIARLTELRGQAVTASVAKNAINAAVQNRLGELESFDPDTWAREHGLGEYPLVSATAHIYRVATQLYCALTLGWAFAAWWPAGGGAPRRVLQERLVRLLDAVWDRISNHGTLLWPLIIAGVAAADGDAKDRAFIGRCFQTGSRTRSMFVKFSRCAKKVERIWLDGTTEWEDCFTEPFVCIA